ncbi:hypothetical protein [Pseudomonas aeruginosa]|uniref:hypothetical protein n=1 Tax=Pseudomonas aeruginosa TaxID=287 RepID=UPI001F1F7961|nr:hypothetical protein [Pseudomonas aeruginosa]
MATMLHEPEEYRLFSLWMVVFMAIGWFGGWVYAHYTVAEECRKLGKFYVGKTIFECKAITDSKGRTLTEEDKENGNG